MLGICGGSFRARLTSRFSQLPLASRLKFEKYPSFTHFTMMSSTSQGIILRAPQMPDPENTILMLCDVQDRFGQLIPNMKRIVASSTMLMNTAHELKMAVICTEQYPKVFGKTVKELASDKNKIVEKFKFSMCCNEVSEYIDKLDPKPKNVILTGMETHVCVLQTCFDLINKGYNIHLCIDATGSQRDLDKQVAIRRLETAGVNLTTSESIVFQLLKHAKHPQFKPVQKFVKEHINAIKAIEQEASDEKDDK